MEWKLAKETGKKCLKIDICLSWQASQCLQWVNNLDSGNFFTLFKLLPCKLLINDLVVEKRTHQQVNNLLGKQLQKSEWIPPFFRLTLSQTSPPSLPDLFLVFLLQVTPSPSQLFQQGKVWQRRFWIVCLTASVCCSSLLTGFPLPQHGSSTAAVP